MKPLLALLLFPAVALAVPVPKGKPVEPLPAKVAKAWADAGMTILWGGMDAEGWWSLSPWTDGLADPIPCVVADRLPEASAKLPPLGRPYGLCLKKQEDGYPANWADRFPNRESVHHLALRNQDSGSGSSFFGDDDLKQVARFPALRSLDLSHTWVTDKGMARLAKMTDLAYLDIRHTEIGDKGMARLRHHTKLRTVRMQFTKVTEAALEHLAASTGLETLQFAVELSSAGIDRLGSFQSLHRVSVLATALYGGAGDEDRSVEFVLAGWEGLRRVTHLELRGAKVTQAAMGHLKEFKHLRALDLGYAIFDSEGLAAIRGLDKLKDLRLGYTPLTDAGLAHVASLTGLERLELEGYAEEVTTAGLAHIRNLTELRWLTLGSKGELHLHPIAPLTKLEYLKVGECMIGDKGFAAIKGLTRLESLDLPDHFLHDEDLQHLAGLTNLRVLGLNHNNISGYGLRHLDKLVLLDTIGLAGHQFQAENLEQLARFPRLRRLDFGYVDKKIITALPGEPALQSLEDLNLVGTDETPITLDETAKFRKLKALKRLRISGGDWYPDVPSEYRKALPGCLVTTDPRPCFDLYRGYDPARVR